MKILIIGGEGTIGKKLTENFAEKHEIITAGRNSGNIHVDISNSRSIEEMFHHVGKVGAVISTAGEAKWDTIDNLTEEDFHAGIKSKLMGQINLVRIGKTHIVSQGSITLTTGILADKPVEMTTIAAMVNGAIHSFVRAMSLETNGLFRINAVSAAVVEDAYEKYKAYFPGHKPVHMNSVVHAYQRSVEGNLNGEVIKVYN